MPFDLSTISTNLGVTADARRRLDEARVGLDAFESFRTALDWTGTGDARLTGIGAVCARIPDFNAARIAAESVWDATAGIKEATAGVGAVPLAHGLASVTFPKPAIDIPEPVLGLETWSLKGVLKEPMVPYTSVFAQAADTLRLGTEGMLSPLSEASRQPVLEVVQGLAGLSVQPGIARPLVQSEWVTTMSSALTERGALGAFRSSGVFDAIRIFEDVSAGVFCLSESLAPYFEIIARAARDLAEYAASRPDLPHWGVLGYKALEVLEALDSGRHWIADAFLRSYLRLYPTPERREALWMVLKKGFEAPFTSPPLWLTLAQGRATAYLKKAVYNGAERIRRDREMEDRLWGKLGEAPLVLDPELSGVPRTEDPAVIVARKMDDRAQILEALLTEGTSRDQEIVRLVRAGEHDRAEIRNVVGSSNLQSFERKAQRMREKISSS